MMEFSLWKQIKKKLRRNKRPLLTLGSLLIAMLILANHVQAAPILMKMKSDLGEEAPDAPVRSVIELLASETGPFTLKLRKVYLCGEEQQTLGSKTSIEVIAMMRENPGWTATLNQDGEVVLEQLVDDLSEHCKGRAYFSLDKTGKLSLFDGPPKKEKVLRTFFQLDIEYMESSLPKERVEQLSNGIRISDKDEYNSVLSTFSDFALERSEKVMSPS